MKEPAGESELDWVLVLAPFRKDADYIATLLREHEIVVSATNASDNFDERLLQSPGVIIVTHEALNPDLVRRVAERLYAQPDWSEVPIVVLLERSAQVAKIRAQLASMWPRSRLLFTSRPIAPLELVNTVQSNLLVRLRQRQVRDSLEREKELRLELNHRVKNLLASVASIFQMTRRGAVSVDELSTNFAERLQALSKVHSAVFDAGGEEISLLEVVEVTLSPYNSDEAKRIGFSGPNVTISRDAGTTIALCLHELTTNAIKYGALSRPEGVVEVRWSLDDDESRTMVLSWIETNGPTVLQPTHQGFGTRYVRSALGSLFGSPPDITFAEKGFRCVATGPVSRLLV